MNEKNDIRLFLVTSIFSKAAYDFLCLKNLQITYIGNISYGINFSYDLLPVSWFIYIIATVFLYEYIIKKENELTLHFILLHYLYFLPLNSATYLENTGWYFCVISNVYWFMLVLFSGVRIKIKQNREIRSVLEKVDSKILASNVIFYILCFSFAVMCLFYVYRMNGLSLTLDFVNVYGARAEFVGSTNEFTSFLYHFGGTIVLAMAMYYGLTEHKYVLFALGLIAQLGIFSLAREKGTLFSILLLFAIIMLNKTQFLNRVNKYIHYGVLLFFALQILFQKTGFNFFFMLVTRRLMYLPTNLAIKYVDFFTRNKVLLFTQDVFLVNRLHIGRHDQSVLGLINSQYFGGIMPSPNTGMLGEAYMHLGGIGIFIFPIITIIYLRIMNKYIRHFDVGIQIYITYHIVQSMLNIPITGGIMCVTYLPIIPFTYFVLKFQRNSKRGYINEYRHYG